VESAIRLSAFHLLCLRAFRVFLRKRFGDCGVCCCCEEFTSDEEEEDKEENRRETETQRETHTQGRAKKAKGVCGVRWQV
jgi:hypothetical protein